MRKLPVVFFLIFCFSLFAQTAAPKTEEKSEEKITEKDFSQEYLAKSAMAVNAVGWTRDGNYFATSWNNSVILWNAASNTIAAIYSNTVTEKANHLSNVTSLQFTSDGRYMLSVRDDNTVLVHSIGTNSDSTLISGTGKSISDAVFAGDYKIILPLDGKNLYESYRLTENGQYVVEEKLDFADGIWGLSSTPNGKKILATSENGKICLIDTTNWEVLSEADCYTLTRIKPKFANDGIHFLSALEQNKIAILSSTDESDFYTISDSAGFSYAAEFSSDSSKIVVGLNTGYVKIYDIASGFEENSFKLAYGDSAKSLAFSPDDKYVLIGTEQGFIYRWVLDGSEFVPEDEVEDGGLQNALVLSLGYGRLNTSYYMGSLSLDVGYRNYFRPPFFWGLGAQIGAGLPGSEFPYTYYEGGESLNAPTLYTLGGGGLIGLVYYNETYDFHVFSEAGVGVNTRVLYNNSLNHAHKGKFYFGSYAELLVGAQWKWFRVSGGVQYDTNLHWLTKVNVGVAIPTKSFRTKKK